ncbi:anti-sigma factor domain-containing protein [Methyloversatilis sp.]|uniref:anti-sigma factor n=1 Tax=Methyloversatilis sp. TaxID=2569862 RepID=UPI002736D1ED|nr:anti-sigma factor [Methyloversatilis sp.]MDP2870860.1 anti-sigma factor [Methyloversatilis sp.]MDP3287748.1 anti-sigma factor [Methyloversatilis sp.]MDP3455932.1 anti-sigma factor [Methyloversatilis sp.]MDP3579727.1 anti-sigma factor [Methyloversatilis sp.]
MSEPMDNDEIAGLYVLGLLDDDEHAQVSRQLATDPALAAAVIYWEERLLPLAAMVEPETLPPALWSRIERSIAPVTRTAPLAQASAWSRLWDSLAFWRSLAATGFAAATILAVAGLSGTPRDDTPRYMVVLVAPDDKAPGWVIQASTEQSLKLIPLGSSEVPPAKAFQFWTKADKWQGPVSLGLVQPGRTLDVKLDKLPPLENNQLFEITLEPEQGSPIGRPTGPILFIGRAVKVM